MNVVVVGGGPAGMIAGITSAEEGNNVILVEKNSSLGNKLKITGKGRCNLTFDGDEEKFRNNIVQYNDKDLREQTLDTIYPSMTMANKLTNNFWIGINQEIGQSQI